MIGSGPGLSLNDLLEVTMRLLHARYMPGGALDASENLLDICRAKEYLNWQPTMGLLAGMWRTYERIVKVREK